MNSWNPLGAARLKTRRVCAQSAARSTGKHWCGAKCEAMELRVVPCAVRHAMPFPSHGMARRVALDSVGVPEARHRLHAPG